MKDFLGNEIKVGDKVVALKYTGTSAFLYKGEVVGFQRQFVSIGNIEEKSVDLKDEMLVTPVKVVVINDAKIRDSETLAKKCDSFK